MFEHARAILWAQWRTLWNFYPHRNLGGMILTLLLGLFWYGMWAVGAFAVALLLARPEPPEFLPRMLPTGLALVCLYWQLVPILMVSTGASLDLRRLLAYPIPHTQLFAVEVLLRLTTGLEMLIVLAAATGGLLWNPALPFWAPAGLVPFTLMNLFVSAGLRDLVMRLLARKRLREAAALLLVLVFALPQLIAIQGLPRQFRDLSSLLTHQWLPWAAAARVAQGQRVWDAALILAAWTAVAYWFARRQFESGLRREAIETPTAARKQGDHPRGWVEALYRLPSALLADPLGNIVEKEIRFLSRAPRFRLVFFMGFSFGLLIWLPLAFGRTGIEESSFTGNYLAFVSVYALLLLGEVTFWNCFGFDRAAAQLYFLFPVRPATVLAGKNIAAALFVLLEVTAVALVCFLLRMPLSPARLAESYAVTMVMAVYLVAIGNLGSIRYPRPVDPAQSWRSASAGKFQALLLLIYPVISIPVLLAYGARYAFDSHLAFYAVLAFGAALGAVVYWVAMDSAVATAGRDRERILSLLSQGGGPMKI